jgi:REP element-mobilizing transposase RayT
MGYPRSMTVLAEQAGFYHCISRCVRRAWLCGEDPVSGRNFDHRRGWIERRLIDLTESFPVGLYAWAVMSNHTHVVLRIDPLRPRAWSDEEVAYRWARLTRTLEPAAEHRVRTRMERVLADPEYLAEVRRRLGSVSWFMRFLNECIARQANSEDECTGRFWEGRFHCQALLDEPAVLACMAYVDLNPVRAGLAADLSGSDFTTIQRRLRRLELEPGNGEAKLDVVAGESSPSGPSISNRAYVELVQWTGRKTRPRKPVASTGRVPLALASVRGPPDWWVGCVSRIESVFGTAVGLPRTLRAHASATGRLWLRGCR